MNSSKNNHKIFFRVDYGGLIGFGHLSRCLSIAEAFSKKGFEPVFVVRERDNFEKLKIKFETYWLKSTPLPLKTEVNSWIDSDEKIEAFEFLNLINSPSKVFVDHYGLNLIWQKEVRANGHKVIVLQDLENADFSADYLLNYNVGSGKKYKEIFKLHKDTTFLLGPQFAPLNESFSHAHNEIAEQTLVKNFKVQTIGIYLGGVQLTSLQNVAFSIIQLKYFTDKKIEWVVNSELEKIAVENITGKCLNLIVLVRLPSLMELYKRVQLFIGTGGVSFLERASLGLWQLNFLAADNQIEVTNAMVSENLGYLIGDIRKMQPDEMGHSIEKLLDIDQIEISKVITKAFESVDGKGAEKIASIFEWSFRKVDLSDSHIIFSWRNNPEIYKYLFNPTPVALADHETWMNKITANRMVLFLIAEYQGCPAGTVRFDLEENLETAEIGIYLAPDLHGRKLSASMLLASEVPVKKYYKSLKKIVAKVLLENTASEKMFEKSGYKKILVEKNYVQLTKLLEN